MEQSRLRITVVEASGLAGSAAPARVSVRLGRQLLGQSPPAVPAPLASWNFQVETLPPAKPTLLSLEVTRPGHICCCLRVQVAGCSFPVDHSTDFESQAFPLWDAQRQTVGSLLVSVFQSRTSGPCGRVSGGLTNRAPEHSSSTAQLPGAQVPQVKKRAPEAWPGPEPRPGLPEAPGPVPDAVPLRALSNRATAPGTVVTVPLAPAPAPGTTWNRAATEELQRQQSLSCLGKGSEPLSLSLAQAEQQQPGTGPGTHLKTRSRTLGGAGLQNRATDEGTGSRSAAQCLSLTEQQPGTRVGGGGLQNQAAEDGTGSRPNALPCTLQLLEGLELFSPESQEACQALAKATEELRYVPRGDLEKPEARKAMKLCSSRIEKLFQHSLESLDDKAAGRAIWLAGRLPQPQAANEGEDGDGDGHGDDVDGDDAEAEETLQVRLRRGFHQHHMQMRLDQAETLIPDAKDSNEKLWSLMDLLDLAGSHAMLAEGDTGPRVKAILSRLQPSISQRIERLLDEEDLEEVEGILNALGASRREAMALNGVTSRLEALKGLALLRSALTPAASQVGFPVLKERLLRHATMTARTALLDVELQGQETQQRLSLLLLQELLPTCVEHSSESLLAALQTAFELLPVAEDVWAAMRIPYDRLSGERKRDLATQLPAACCNWGVFVPTWLLSTQQAECQQALRAALVHSDPNALRAALVQTRDTEGGREACAGEFKAALESLRSQHRLPAGWNVESMLAPGAGGRLLAKEEVAEPEVIRAFSKLLQSTANPIWTRDRRGRVTRGFEAVRAVHIMNATTWAKYAQRRDEVASECTRSSFRSDDAFWQSSLNGILMTKGAFGDLESLLSVPSLVENANEAWLMHGTSHAGAAAISSDDFDIARARPTGLYGAGIYLAESVSKCDEYVKSGDASGPELFPLLLCRVCLGNVFYCDEKLPDRKSLEWRCLRQNWHSVLGDRKKTSGTFREFIVYDPTQVFPAYIVYYRRTA